MGINFNGKETPTGTTDTSTALWLQVDTSDAQSFDLGDLPDLTSQYDSNRLAAVKLKWYPGIPNGALSAGYIPTTLTYDRDGIENDVLAADLSNQLEQVNGVRVKNMYRPWKAYIKSPKYRINTRIPSNTAGTFVDNQYQPNENMAGQWKPVNQGLSGFTSATFASTDMGSARQRGTHLLVTVPTPDGYTPTVEAPLLLGTMVITSYYVYKDRK